MVVHLGRRAGTRAATLEGAMSVRGHSLFEPAFPVGVGINVCRTARVAFLHVLLWCEANPPALGEGT